MREILARAGLQAVEKVRDDVAAVSGRRISRAELSRRGQLNDATVTRGLSSVPPRITTVTRYVAAMLSTIGDLTNREPISLSTQPIPAATERAAQALAYAVGELANAKAPEIRRAKRIRTAHAELDELVSGRVGAHVLVESALVRLVSAWLDDPESPGLRLAAIGAATAVVTRAPQLQAVGHG